MGDNAWDENELKDFREAAQSLKLFKRAELLDEQQRSQIKNLYVDPLPADHVFQTVLRSSTAFLIGRKGTGKSTIFQRVQYELRHMKGYASAYVDIKTVYESACTDPSLLEQAGPDSLNPEQLQRLLLYRIFLKTVINEIKAEIKKKLKESKWERMKSSISSTVEDLFESLDDLLECAEKVEFMSVLNLRKEQRESSTEKKKSTSSKVDAGVEASHTPKASANFSAGRTLEDQSGQKLSYGDVLIRIFNVKELLAQLGSILNAAGIRHLFVFVDDFSELPEDAMKVVVDVLLAPLNNWSEELIKFKIAAYPHRIYYGEIDKTKIDEVYLDLYHLYGGGEVSAMEEKAIDFTRRLVNNRLQYFGHKELSAFIEADEIAIWRTLFYASLGNPRILGHLLYYLHETALIYGNKIGIKAIRDAAARYYDEKVESYFRINRFLHERFGERVAVFGLKELLESIVKRARDLRKHRDSAVMREISGVPPTSHFHFAVDLEALLATLELNFFVTKYFEMSDRDGRKVAVYCLNYGLCQKYSITFGRPLEKREQRLYFVERVFDYTAILRKFMRDHQEIKCTNCDAVYEVDKLEMLKLYGMQCPSCRVGICEVTNLSKKYADLLNQISPELLLPPTELGMLQILESESRQMYAGEIASELDKSYQLIGKRGKALSERGLVNREENSQGRRIFTLSELAKQSYFATDGEAALDLDSAEGEIGE